MNTKELLGLKVKEFRKSKKITQEKLSELIGVDNGYISKLEIGQNFPSIKTLEKISKVLNTELYKFFQYANIKDENLKNEISKIYDELPKDKQVLLYQVARGFKQ